MRRSRGSIRSIRPRSALRISAGREGYVARQVERWSKQYRASETETIDEMDRLMAWLPAPAPPTPVRLVHGDYRLDNCIMAPTRPHIIAVLDWELVDVRRSARRSRLSPDAVAHAAFGKPAPASARLLGLDLNALGFRRWRLCRAVMSREPASIRAHLASLSRLQFLPHRGDPAGHLGRVRDGTAASDAAAMAALVRPLAANGLGFCRGRPAHERSPRLALRSAAAAPAASPISRCSKSSTRWA